MQWRFTIQDRNGFDTVIDEPVGWADIVFKLSRDKDKHGIFYDYTANSFQFFGIAKRLIQAEYETYGVEGYLFLRIEYDCNESYEWDLFCTGRILFAKYKETMADDCNVDVAIDNISEIVTFKNRMDQSVDLTATKCFDDVTDIAQYEKLPFTMSLPSKAIQITSKANNEEAQTSVNFVNDPQWYGNTTTGGTEQMRAQILPGFTKIVSTDIQTTTIYNEPQLNNGGFNGAPTNGLTPTIDVQDVSEALKCVNSLARLRYRWKGSITTEGNNDTGLYAGLQVVKLPPGKDETVAENYEMIAEHVFFHNPGVVHDFENDLDITAEVGDKYWFYIFVSLIPSTYTSYVVNEDPECFIDINMVSKCEPTDADVFMINEAVSRTIESITNNQLRLYSEYLGRVDSQPFNFEKNGAGSLAAITNGLKIRRVKNQDGTAPSLFVTLNQLYNDLNALHNIGLGVEKLIGTRELSDDLTDDRANSIDNNFVVRIENWKWFYRNQIILRCLDVDKITRTVQPDKHITQFTTGYDKWEAEQYNGLDEFLTKRKYATQLTQVSNSVEKVSKMIASGFALEITRRQDATSTDWRYDNECFIICVEPDGDSYKVELGNILNPQNILDPATIYNYRISPVRNLLRWFDRLIASYRNPDGGFLKFTEGDGNIVASGQMMSDFARIENKELQENQNIDITVFAEESYAKAPFFLEKIQFSYPLTVAEYKSLLVNPYCLILYSYKGRAGAGWIDEVSYKPNDGLADFSLIPSKMTGVDNSLNSSWIITEDGEVITTEGGEGFVTEGPLNG